MPDVVEIYLCKPGQDLNQGRIVHSSEIGSKDDARSDAENRCRIDPTLARIAYYTTNEQGDFRLYFTYTNPNPVILGQAEKTKKKKKKRRQKKKTLWARFRRWLRG